MPNPPHTHAVDRGVEALRRVFQAGFWVRHESPLVLGPGKPPEPDLAVVVGERRDFANRHPHAREAVLVVEVADTTLARDTGAKADRYARAGIEDYWVLDLNGRVLEVFRGPVVTKRVPRGRYRDRELLDIDEVIAPLAASGANIAVRDLLPE